MKRFKLIAFSLLLATSISAQDFRGGMNDLNEGNSVNGGVGFTQVGDATLVGLVLTPEFQIWKFGVGVNVPLMVDVNSGKVRTEIFKDGVGALRLIRYARFGVQKQDPFYVRVGELTGTMIGFGSLVNNYTNTLSYEKRKLGAHFDLLFAEKYGLEGMYSDFDPASRNLLALRPYYKPLGETSIPIVKTLEVGFTFVTDKDQTNILSADTTKNKYVYTKDGISAWAIDAGVILVNSKFLRIDFFTSYSRLNVSSDTLDQTVALASLADPNNNVLGDGFDNGGGFSVGTNFRFNFIADLFATDVRIERQIFSEHYLPQFFDAAYEINKDSKILGLAYVKQTSGIYGSIMGHVLNKVQIGGSLLLPDNVDEESPALLTINANMVRLADKFSFYGSYVKGNLTDLGDAFKFDDRSLAKIRTLYHINDFFVTGMDYYWAFVEKKNGRYKASHYAMPYFGISYQF